MLTGVCMCVCLLTKQQRGSKREPGTERLNELHGQQGPLVRQSSAGEGTAQPDVPNLYPPPETILQAHWRRHVHPPFA